MTAAWTLARCAATACATLLGACAGDGAGLDQAGRPLVAGGGGGVLMADFASIQEQVLTPVCTVCHAGGAAPQGLRLDAANSFALLVGVPSNEVPSLLRVQPGDPDHSYLVQKIEGHAAVGAQMPFGAPPLPAATIAVIRQWISDGALSGAMATGAPGFAALAVTPAMHDLVAVAPARIVVAFSRELDQTRIDASSLRLEAVTAVGAADAGLVPVFARVAPGNARALMVEPAFALAPGRYRLTVGAAPSTGLSSVDGERLAGSTGAGTDVVLTDFEVQGSP